MNAKRWAVVLYRGNPIEEATEVVTPFYSEEQARNFAYTQEVPFSVVQQRSPTLAELQVEY